MQDVAYQDPDAVAQLAYLSLTTGNTESDSLLQLLPELRTSGRFSPTARTEFEIVREYAKLVMPQVASAPASRDEEISYTVGIGSYVYALSVRAMAERATGDRIRAFDAVMRAIAAATESDNRHWLVRLEVLLAAVTEDAARLGHSIDRAREHGELAVLDVVEAVVDGLELLQPLPATVQDSIVRWPGRWLPVLRRKVADGYNPTSHAAARVLDEHGELSDVPLLRAYDRTFLRGTRMVGLGRKLNSDTKSDRAHPRSGAGFLGGRRANYRFRNDAAQGRRVALLSRFEIVAVRYARADHGGPMVGSRPRLGRKQP